MKFAMHQIPREWIKRLTNNGLLWLVEEKRIVRDADSTSNVIAGMAWICTPRSFRQKKPNADPGIDSNTSVTQISDCAIQLWTKLLYRFRMNDDVRAQCAPQILVRKPNSCLKKFSRGF